jgi:hypothetical protein
VPFFFIFYGEEVDIMPNPVRNATVRARINDIVTDIMLKTSSENVICDDGQFLSEKLSEMLLEIGERPTQAEMQAAIDKAIADLVDEAPEILDTLKEIAEYIVEYGDLLEALQKMVDEKSSIFYEFEMPQTLKVGDMWVQPVVDASVLHA